VSAIEKIGAAALLEAAMGLAPLAVKELIDWLRGDSDESPTAALSQLPPAMKTALGHERMRARMAKSSSKP
jgi:hypothetical protein